MYPTNESTIKEMFFFRTTPIYFLNQSLHLVTQGYIDLILVCIDY